MIADEVNKRVLKLVKDINYGEIKGTYNIVIATLSVFKDIINYSEWDTATNLMDIITKNGKYLTESLPLEASIGNMVRRILKIIREEYRSKPKNKTEETDIPESLHKILTAERYEDTNYDIVVPYLKSALIEHINEVEVELEICSENITQQASEHIHSNEIIMTIGKSNLVEEFFKKAASTRTFEVIVAEGGSSLNGHEMALNLAKAKIKTTLISDVAIFCNDVTCK
ncbi:hypothetical protein M0802_008783 [Mischocyttarus mexicanus]|nr:hypothetical protein M0802_008783 [Mischocyttarus mexicanus]